MDRCKVCGQVFDGSSFGYYVKRNKNIICQFKPICEDCKNELSDSSEISGKEQQENKNKEVMKDDTNIRGSESERTNIS